MDVSVVDAGPLRKTLTLTYTQAEIAEREAGKIAQYSTQINLKGFRKGKTPKGLVKKRFGQAIQNEIVDELIQSGIRDAMQEHKLSPIGPFADEDRKVDNGLSYVTSFDIKPEVKLPDAESLSVSKEAVSVSDEELNEEINGFAKRAGDHKELTSDDKLQADDSVTFSGKITSGDELVRDIHDLNHFVGGYPLFGKEPAELLELISKLSVGDTLAFDTTLPERFKPEEWAGKEAQISVTIQSGTRMQPAEINDEFAKRMGVEDVADLNKRVRESIEQRKEQEQRQKQVDEMIDALIAATSFELPEHLFNGMRDENIQGAEQAKERNPNAADVDAEKITADTERFLRRHLIIDAIISKNNIQAERADLSQQLMMAAWQSGRKAEDLEKELYENGQINQVLHEIVEGKAIEFMLSKILGEEAEAEHVHGPDCDHDHEDATAEATA